MNLNVVVGEDGACEVLVGRVSDDNETLADRGRVVVGDTWEEPEGVGEGIAIRTTTLIIGCGELESDIVEIGWELVLLLLSDDEAGTAVAVVESRFKNLLARVSKEGVVVVETTAVR